MANRVSRRGKKKTVQFRGMFVWIIVIIIIIIILFAITVQNKIH